MTLALETRRLCKDFGSFRALKEVSLKIRSGSIHALLGENGAGKTTLLKTIFGLHSRTSGEIEFHGKSVSWRGALDAIASGVGMVQQHFALVEELTALENILLGAEPVDFLTQIKRQEAQDRLESILPSPHLRVPWNEKVESLSVGEKQRIEILKLLFRNADVLFLDEPTAVLAPHEVSDFFDVLRGLRAKGKTIVIITHKLDEAFALCDEYSVLRGGQLVASGEIQGTTKNDVVRAMIGRDPVPTVARAAQSQKREIVLSCANLASVGVERGSLNGISLTLGQGEILGIAGVEGAGQSQLVEMLLGIAPYKGNLRVLGTEVSETNTRNLRGQGVSLVPEDRLSQGLWPQASCYLNLALGFEDRFARWGILDFESLKAAVTPWSEAMDVRGAGLAVSAQGLSGGNQQKVILAREILGRKPKLLIAHHPTRGVDLGAVEHIHREIQKLAAHGVAVLLISSDLDELMALSDRIDVLFCGRLTKSFPPEQFDAFELGRYMTGAEK